MIPEKAKGNKKQKSYFDFYKYNLDNDISIVKTISKVPADIDNFVQAKIDSYGEMI